MNSWTVACQAPLFMGFSRQRYWSGLPFPPPGYLACVLQDLIKNYLAYNLSSPIAAAAAAAAYAMISIRVSSFSTHELFKNVYVCAWVPQVALVVKNPPSNAADVRDTGSIPGSGRSPPWWHGMVAWQPTPVFLPGESHEQRSLAGYSP